MPDIRILRPHKLGLAKARELAWKWAGEVEQKFDMECTVIEGDAEDTVEFERPGVKGQLMVAADRFALDARLGFLLGVFSQRIQQEIENELDILLAASTKARPAAVRKAAPLDKPAKK
jgi:putative polyhydroxyalkanoate system protein